MGGWLCASPRRGRLKMDDDVKAFRGCARNLILKAYMDPKETMEVLETAVDKSHTLSVETPKSVEVIEPKVVVVEAIDEGVVNRALANAENSTQALSLPTIPGACGVNCDVSSISNAGSFSECNSIAKPRKVKLLAHKNALVT